MQVFYEGIVRKGDYLTLKFVYAQSQLVDFAFYGAYYFGALALFVISSGLGKDVLNSWGYKNGIIYGLLLSYRCI